MYKAYISTERGTPQYSKVHHFDNIGTVTGINSSQTSFEDSGCFICIRTGWIN